MKNEEIMDKLNKMSWNNEITFVALYIIISITLVIIIGLAYNWYSNI